VIAHNTWYEREMVDMVHSKAVIGSEWWSLPLDERNALIFKSNLLKSLDEVLSESERTSRELDEAIQTLSDEDLADPTRWSDWPPSWSGDWTPSAVIASNSFDHYNDHLPDLESLK
jgi:hypothetical protein